MSFDMSIFTERPLVVEMLLFEGHTAVDFVGPYTAFAAAGMEIHLVAETLQPVPGDVGIAVSPTTTYAGCPADPDILFVPGGAVDRVMLDDKAISFLVNRGARASFITSVCNGSLVLAAAGLLDGYRSATHWANRQHLARLGVEVSTERVCIDRNRLSGGGVTAGIDFGLTLVAHILGEESAKFCQLAMEYNPNPPFDAGSPEGAGPAVVARFTQFTSPFSEVFDAAVSRVLERRTAAAQPE
ncbi:DJ-1/PfpI family protein [Amycolatopsis sp. lyj-109]|uniref:DJ-1/PfpI family protein n=1 Tax=Amycolatopsis sp. lyj-109 TaxID=2789287 RepID=UPI00397B90DC